MKVIFVCVCYERLSNLPSLVSREYKNTLFYFKCNCRAFLYQFEQHVFLHYVLELELCQSRILKLPLLDPYK